MPFLVFEANGIPSGIPVSYADVLALRRSQIPLGEKEGFFMSGTRPTAFQLQTILKLVALREDCGSSYEAALAHGATLLVDENGMCSGTLGDAVVLLMPDGRWRANFGDETYATFEDALDAAIESADDEEDEKDGVSGPA